MSDADARRHNQRLIQSLQPGDLVEFPRGPYSHWAVYVGNGKVVHRAGDDDDFASQPNSTSSMSGKMNDKATVREQNLLDVAGSTKAHKNNQLDGTYRPLSRDEIVRRARSKIGEVGYNLIFANCEHFANWCRYDTAISGQVQGVLGFPMQLS